MYAGQNNSLTTYVAKFDIKYDELTSEGVQAEIDAYNASQN